MRVVVGTRVFDAEVAAGFWGRLKGLMFRKEIRPLFIPQCNAVHTFFMRHPLDLVFFDRREEVVRVVRNVRPWRVVGPVPGAWSALELKGGTLTDEDISGLGIRICEGHQRAT